MAYIISRSIPGEEVLLLQSLPIINVFKIAAPTANYIVTENTILFQEITINIRLEIIQIEKRDKN